jgi:hypothetical protein
MPGARCDVTHDIGLMALDYDPWAGYEWPDRAGQPERVPRKKVSES